MRHSPRGRGQRRREYRTLSVILLALATLLLVGTSPSSTPGASDNSTTAASSDDSRPASALTGKTLSAGAKDPLAPPSPAAEATQGATAAAQDVSDATPPRDVTPPAIVRLKLEGGIFAGMSNYLIDNIHRAEAQGATILITVDTPGGALEATRDIVKAFLGSKVPILVWVGPSGARAGSAGVFITMAAHVAAMAPGTNIGAAHPVGGGVGAPGDDKEDPDSKGARARKTDDEVMAEKIENDTLAFIESIASMRGRNAEWALDAVKRSVAVTAEKALELKVIDLLSFSVEEMLEEADGRIVKTADGPVVVRTRGVPVVEASMSLRERLLVFLGEPNLVYLLMLIGMMGIYLEMNHPGAIAPAVIGGLSLLLALTGLSVMPYDVTGIIFIVIAFGCFIAEAYVTSFGLLALAGVGSLVLGGILLFEQPPELQGLPSLEVGVSPAVYWTVAVLSLVIVIPVSILVARSQTRRPVSGQEGLIGTVGKALGPLSTSGGRVFVHGEYWEARSSEPVLEGCAVVVTRVDGLVLEVRPK